MKPTAHLALQLRLVQTFLNQPELQAQQILTFLGVVSQPDIPMAELEKYTGVGQSSVSRNVAKLGRGENPRKPGYGLLEAYEDPEYRKRKLVRLTARGRGLAEKLDKIVEKSITG